MRIFGRLRVNHHEPLGRWFEREVAVLAGRITAADALGQAQALIAEVDPHAHPVHISTSTVDENGRSEHWEVRFDSRALVANLWVEFGFEHAWLRGVPLVSSESASVTPEFWASMNGTQRQVFTDQWFAYPELTGFVDSDAALARLLAEHPEVSLDSDSPEMSLETDRPDELWALTVADQQWWTPLF